MSTPQLAAGDSICCHLLPPAVNAGALKQGLQALFSLHTLRRIHAAQVVFARGFRARRMPGNIEIPGIRGRRLSPVSLRDVRAKETGASCEDVDWFR
ncbi:MAG: hypothetical protein FKY71_16460 [Spiribacter salinus]|uniref:Uncharacterized protein n=1 Tax=Spiribacter salinus TaxID=1335746 RepID=A0A540VIX5_9GAMM|nr:MAG: hypothetical protein FKY71_16460 [Spiribacter salinus]